jgi:hypothetical protein
LERRQREPEIKVEVILGVFAMHQENVFRLFSVYYLEVTG